jgi:hypothetical protein
LSEAASGEVASQMSESAPGVFARGFASAYTTFSRTPRRMYSGGVICSR